MALDMNPRKIARKLYPKDSVAAKKLEEEAKAVKLVLEARTKRVHAIIIPALDYTGKPRIDIGIQGLTPKPAKTRDPFINLLNWILRRHEIKNKTPREVGYAHFDSIDDFAPNVINRVDALIERFSGGNKTSSQTKLELRN